MELGIESLFYGIRNDFEKDTDRVFGLTMKNDSIFVRKRKRNEEIRNTQMLRHPGIDPWNDFVLSTVRTIPVPAGAEPELHVSTMGHIQRILPASAVPQERMFWIAWKTDSDTL